MDGQIFERCKSECWVWAENESNCNLLSTDKADSEMSFYRNQCSSSWSSAPSTRRTWREMETMSMACTPSTFTIRWELHFNHNSHNSWVRSVCVKYCPLVASCCPWTVPSHMPVVTWEWGNACWDSVGAVICFYMLHQMWKWKNFIILLFLYLKRQWTSITRLSVQYSLYVLLSVSVV